MVAPRTRGAGGAEAAGGQVRGSRLGARYRRGRGVTVVLGAARSRLGPAPPRRGEGLRRTSRPAELRDGPARGRGAGEAGGRESVAVWGAAPRAGWGGSAPTVPSAACGWVPLSYLVKGRWASSSQSFP